MKIAVIRKDWVRPGRAERYCANLCRCLAALGHEIYVLARSCDDDLHPAIRHVPVACTGLTSSARNWSFHANAQKALRRLAVDRVYALSRSYPADAFRVSDPLHCSWMDIRYPGAVRNFIERCNPRHRTILALEKAICNPANTKAIITNSALAKGQLLSAYVFPEERIKVVYNGVDLTRFTPADGKPSADFLQLLFVAQDFRRKGLSFIMQALARLKDAAISCRLQVVGGDDQSSFRSEADRLGVAEMVDFIGASKAVEDFYRSADLLVFPTQSDPFANVCLEALACGCPVMTTLNNGAAEVIEEEKTGYLLDCTLDTAVQIARKIGLHASLSRDRRRLMKEACRQTAEKFTIERNALETLAILENL
ncbi:MAG: glycosyltransferase family 4 protein [Syntrophotaleaceae bacterium]